MNAKRFWQVGGAIAIAGILALGWFLIVSPMLTQVSDSDDQRAIVEQQNSLLQAEILNLSTVDVAALEQQLAGRIAQVPTTLLEEEVWRQVFDLVDRFNGDAALRSEYGSLLLQVTTITIEMPSAFKPVGAALDGDASGDGAPPLPITTAELNAAAAAGLLVAPLRLEVNGAGDGALWLADQLQSQSQTFLLPSLDVKNGDSTLSGYFFYLPRSTD